MTDRPLFLMQSPEATLYCPNPLCQAPNPESHRFCQQCRTALPRRYLWAIGEAADRIPPGELVGDRYWCKHSRVFLDTKPGLLPESPEDLPIDLEAYLKLFAYQQHIPQLYTLIPVAQPIEAELVLLENAPIFPFGIEATDGTSRAGQLMPTLASEWSQGRAMRQLHWLWQMAQLWDPLQQQSVAPTLLNPNLIRVEGALLRLLELQPHPYESGHATSPTLADLGQLWSHWQPSAQPAIAEFMTQLCQNLMQGDITTAEQLVGVLDQAMIVCGQSQLRQIRIATLTDQGPTRQRNEDACYPASGTTGIVTLPPAALSSTSSLEPLVLVCDGIGGHEGGNIASNLAIATIQKRVQPILQSALPLDSTRLTIELEEAVLQANDLISERNDQEQRQERQRMGTTLVMALAQGAELYITHVGDSRAYWITPSECHQVTLDDDLAAREVRLGYSLYRDALQQPSSGSLVQALGMSTSTFLHPTVQRFVLDEDSLFLLCSDGLSDNDRVQESWQSVLLPVLEGTVDLATATQQLVAIANEQNGHDNVTVGLIHCRVTDVSSAATLPPIPATLAFPPVAPAASVRPTQLPATHPFPAPKPPPILERRSSSLVPILAGVLLFLGLGSLLTVLLLSNIGRNERVPASSNPVRLPSPPASPGNPSLSSPVPVLSTQSRVQVTRTTLDNAGQNPLVLLPKSAIAASGSTPTGGSLLTAGTVLEVINQQVQPDGSIWLEMKVCSLPDSVEGNRAPSGPGLPIAVPGSTGWIEQAAIAPLVTSNLSLTAAQLGQCVVPSPNPPPPSP